MDLRLDMEIIYLQNPKKKLTSLAISLALILPISLGYASSGDTGDLSDSLRNKLDSHSGGQGIGMFQLPNHDDFDNIPQDPNNPITREKVRLGRFLYHETAVGTQATDADRIETWSCASCHHVAAGFKAGVPQGIGEGGVGFGADGSERTLAFGLDATAPAGSPELPDVQPIASPTVLNSAFQELMLWNGSFGNAVGSPNASEDAAVVEAAGPPPVKANTFGLAGLETQVLAGTNVHRLRFDHGSVMQTNSEYRYLYDRAYPDGDTGFIPDNGTVVTTEALGAAKAIAAYERTILSTYAPFQQWLRGRDDAMTIQQLRGANLFFGKADCASCHTGPALSSKVGASENELFFAIGFNDFDVDHPQVHGIVDEATMKGRGGFTGDAADNYKFKIPPLYNLTDTNVFGHGASFTSVRDVVEYKNEAIPQNSAAQNLSDKFVPLGLSDSEIDDLVVFLEEALHDQWLDRYVPHSLPSDQCFPVADIQSAMELGCLTDRIAHSGPPVCEFASSDPDGDGWGWENDMSCTVTSASSTTEPTNPSTPSTVPTTHPICESADSDSDGDGWGWENMRSCRVN